MDNLNDEDRKLFLNEMSEVRPLTNKHVLSKDFAIGKKKNPLLLSTKKYRHRASTQQTSTKLYNDLSDACVDAIDPDQTVELNLKVSDKQFNKFKKQAVTSSLDLHGYKREVARECLYRFIQKKSYAGETCVRIVHGKAYEVKNREYTLKSLTIHWLKQIDFVLALYTAPARFGGSGALHVLLKNSFNKA